MFIDEISQVIETFNSDKLFKKTDIELVYKLLKTIIKNAECVIVADANINQQTLDFIESCRLGEKLHIVEVAPTDENKTVHLYNSFRRIAEIYPSKSYGRRSKRMDYMRFKKPCSDIAGHP